jgi:4'-phosphopantetheinyl transferase
MSASAAIARAPCTAGPDVDVWLLRPEACSPEDLARVAPLLSTAERDRYRGFAFDRNRIEFLATRALVRLVLSSYHDVTPAAWRFRTNAFGRPEVDPSSSLRFNLSNHPTMIVCAVREGAELGVDVEPLARGTEILELADTVFTPSEREALRALSERAHPDRAVSLWTLKEAYIKARGMGFSLPLEAFALSFDAPRPQISFAPPIDDDPARWSFRTMDWFGHRIALAMEATEAAPVVRVHHVLQMSPAGLQSWRLADWS